MLCSWPSRGPLRLARPCSLFRLVFHRYVHTRWSARSGAAARESLAGPPIGRSERACHRLPEQPEGAIAVFIRISAPRACAHGDGGPGGRGQAQGPPRPLL